MRPAYSRVRCLPHPKVGFPPQRGLSATFERGAVIYSCAVEKAHTLPSLRRAEYCNRPSPSEKLFRSTAPVRKWAGSRRNDQVFQEYRREFKRRFAWIKAGKLTRGAIRRLAQSRQGQEKGL